MARDTLPSGHVLAYLPPLGNVRRNPAFWSDADVRDLVIACHRQVTIQQALTRIRSNVGPERTPSKSALARAWMRIDKALAQSRVRPARRER